MSRFNLSKAQLSLHQNALSAAEAYRKSEWRLIEALTKVSESKLFKSLGYTSLFQYATDALKLSEASAYSFITVTRKSVVVPALKEAIKREEISISKATRLASCINRENASELIGFAKSHTNREIEFEVARRNPKAKKADNVRAESEDRVRLSVSVSRECLKKIERIKNLLAQNEMSTDLECVLDVLANEYIKRHDPVAKAKRAQGKKVRDQLVAHQDNANSKPAAREAFASSDHKVAINGQVIPTVLEVGAERLRGDSNGNIKMALRVQSFLEKSKHQDRKDDFLKDAKKSHRILPSARQKHEVFARDLGRCTFVGPSGQRCRNERYLHLHHIHPVSLGGSNDPDNLTILCSVHHELVHQLSLPIEGQVNWLRSPRAQYAMLADNIHHASFSPKETEH